MRMKAILVVLFSAVAAFGQSIPRVLHVQTGEAAAQSTNCELGTKYDDGTFPASYGIRDEAAPSITMVMKFDLPAGTTALDQVCNCFAWVSSFAPQSMTLEAVVYDDNGPSGAPGTFLGAVPFTGSIPVVERETWLSFSLAGAGIVLPDTSVYVGARWAGGEVYMCGDHTPPTPLRPTYTSVNGGGMWYSLPSVFGGDFPPRVMGIRAEAAAGSTEPCTPSATAMCLNGNRYKVEATWQSSSASGTASPVALTDDTGYFWFFSATNVEVVVKVLNGCTLNSRYWVFAGGLSDVRVNLIVTDTQTGTVKTYTNPLGTPFAPIQDTGAFATCP